MPNEKQKSQTTTSSTAQTVTTAFAAAGVTIFFAPITLPALPTLALATGAGGVAVAGRRALKHLVQGKREREEDGDTDEQDPHPSHQQRDTLAHNLEDYDTFQGYEDTGSDDAIQEMMGITDYQLFVEIFVRRTQNNKKASPDKGAQTKVLKTLAQNNRNLLQNMIKIGYETSEEARRAANLFWQIKTGTKTIDDLTEEERKLLKILILKAAADVPWWKDHDNDDDDQDTSAAEATNNDDDDPDAGACSIAYEAKTNTTPAEPLETNTENLDAGTNPITYELEIDNTPANLLKIHTENLDIKYPHIDIDQMAISTKISITPNEKMTDTILLDSHLSEHMTPLIGHHHVAITSGCC